MREHNPHTPLGCERESAPTVQGFPTGTRKVRAMRNRIFGRLIYAKVAFGFAWQLGRWHR